jgi:hypothetical protein
MKISVVPTRGMNVLEAVAGKVRLGWDSPVSEVVNPAFIELNGRGGVGWLEGWPSGHGSGRNASLAWPGGQHTGFKSRAEHRR